MFILWRFCWLWKTCVPTDSRSPLSVIIPAKSAVKIGSATVAWFGPVAAGGV